MSMASASSVLNCSLLLESICITCLFLMVLNAKLSMLVLPFLRDFDIFSNCCFLFDGYSLFASVSKVCSSSKDPYNFK